MILEPVDYLPVWLAEILFWIFYNQTLIAGFAALIAALLTIRIIREQIAQSERQISDLRRREHLATISGLPNALVEIIDYADASWKASLEILRIEKSVDWPPTEGSTVVHLEAPTFPFEALRTVQMAIVTADDEDAEKLADLLAFSQIQNSRQRSLIEFLNPINRTHSHLYHRGNIHRAARDALELRIRAGKALMYARRQTKFIESLPGNEVLMDFLHGVDVEIQNDLEEYLTQTWSQHYTA